MSKSTLSESYISPLEALSGVPLTYHTVEFDSWIDAVLGSCGLEEFFEGKIPGTVRQGWVDAFGSFEDAESFIFDNYINSDKIGFSFVLLHSYMQDYADFTSLISYQAQVVAKLVNNSDTAEYRQLTTLVLLGLCFPDRRDQITNLVLPENYDLNVVTALLRRGIAVEHIPAALSEDIDSDLIVSMTSVASR
jgi:hypothetical protein